MIYQAAWILTFDGPPIRNGWLRVEHGQITEIGSENIPEKSEIVYFPNDILLPGFINAHCHLELSEFKGLFTPKQRFTHWVMELRRETENYTKTLYRQSVENGIQSLLAGGTTTVVDVGNSGAAIPALLLSPLRGFALLEVLGLDPSLADIRIENTLKDINTWKNQSNRIEVGLAPHSTYACSPNLLAKLFISQNIRQQPITFHAAESLDEWELFSHGTGNLQEFCKSIFANAPTHLNSSPILFLKNEDILPANPLIVHGNFVHDLDWELLKSINATIVHCPSSHQFFGHKPFALHTASSFGIPVCFGTDSLASGDSLSMLEQIKLAKSSFPKLSPEEILQMAVLNGAAAIGKTNRLGKLKPGFSADFIGIQTLSKLTENPYASVLQPESSVKFSVIDGIRIF